MKLEEYSDENYTIEYRVEMTEGIEQMIKFFSLDEKRFSYDDLYYILDGGKPVLAEMDESAWMDLFLISSSQLPVGKHTLKIFFLMNNKRKGEYEFEFEVFREEDYSSEEPTSSVLPKPFSKVEQPRGPVPSATQPGSGSSALYAVLIVTGIMLAGAAVSVAVLTRKRK